MPVPFLGRLNVTEYAALIGSFLLVGLEAFIRIFTLALPPSLLQLCYGGSRRLFNRLTTPAQKRAEQRRKSVSASIRDACDFVDLCAMFGYTAEEHVVRTEDGYLLGLHRLAWRKGEEDTKVNRGPNSVKKKVVYLHHGLLMNSEVWVCLTDEKRCLPFVLVERGFDVWLGNNRGNKYSKKSIRCSPTTTEFWNFSIDQFALHDIPNSISYILEITGQPSLSYIGFSQGTAQAFASLSIHPKLNDQVNVFIALAPAMSPAGLSNGIVDALVKASPQVLYLLFGRRSILSSATMWQSILYPPLFTKMIDIGLSFLFNWRTENISTSQKLAAYPHLYSYTSTKSVVHWFQIIRTKSFQMYDDDVHRPLILASNNKYTKVAKYPTRNIKTPIVLVYGGSDSLVDIRAMLRELPRQTVANEIPHYEHLDFLWARDVDQRVFQHVFDALESFTGAEHTREEYERYRSVRRQHTSEIPKEFVRVSNRHLLFGGDDAATTADSDVSTAVGDEIGTIRVAPTESDSDEAATIPEKTPGTATQLEPAPRITSNSSAHQMLRDTQIPSSLGNSRIARPRSKNPMDQGEDKANARNEDGSAAESPVTPISSWNTATSVPAPDGGAGGAAVAGRRDITSQGPITSGTDMMNMRTTPKRRGTGGSSISFESMKGGRGIALGASKAVGGVSTGLPDIESMIGSPSGGTGTGGTSSDETSRRKSLISGVRFDDHGGA